MSCFGFIIKYILTVYRVGHKDMYSSSVLLTHNLLRELTFMTLLVTMQITKLE